MLEDGGSDAPLSISFRPHVRVVTRKLVTCYLAAAPHTQVFLPCTCVSGPWMVCARPVLRFLRCLSRDVQAVDVWSCNKLNSTAYLDVADDSCCGLGLAQHTLCDHYRLDHDQHDVCDKSRNFLAALALGASLLRRLSIGMDWSGKTRLQTLSRFRASMRTRLCLRYH